jgi:hypothetical protein
MKNGKCENPGLCTCWYVDDIVVKIFYHLSKDTEYYDSTGLHREDGPAIDYANGHKAWYLHGKEITQQEFDQRQRLKAFW